jgi:O-antigen/teichoic acid export membrane protein
VKILKNRVYSLILRIFSLFAKFLIVFYLAKFFNLEQVGIYNLFYTSINVGIFLLGLDFYCYSNRRLITDKNKEFETLTDQFIFYIFIFIISIPLFWTLFLLKVIPYKFIFYFYLILLFEHFSQELYRIFIILKKVTVANIIFFIRNGLWIYIAIVLFSGFLSPNLTNLFLLWLSFVIISVILGFIMLHNTIKFKYEYKFSLNRIIYGIKISFPFFLSTIALKILEFLDRYLIKVFHGNEDVGIYTLYYSITSIINIFVFTSVISFLYPKLIIAYQKGLKKLFRRILKKLLFQTTIFSFCSIILVLIGLLLMNHLLKFELSNVIMLMVVIQIFNFILLNISLVFHYQLYATNNDQFILKSTISASVVSVICNFILIPQYSYLGASISMLMANITLLIIRLYYSRRVV